MKDGSQLKATPGKAYLKVLTTETKVTMNGAPALGFAFGEDDDVTGIECITITNDASHRNADEVLYDLQGRKVSSLTKGVYINNNQKVIIK